MLPSVAALGVAACISTYPQRLPGPLLVPEPPRAAPITGVSAPVVTVQRASGPVWVQKAGERGAYELPFYRKRERVPVGTLVRTGAGGRAELLWSPDASNVALFDEGRVTLGDPDRDEPIVSFHAVTRAILVLTPEDRVQLIGGARLAGDSAQPTGTILLETVRGGLVRVINQSKLEATIAFRDELLLLGPGESVDLPTLPTGSAPHEEEASERFVANGIAFAIAGAVERRDEPAGISLTAREDARVRGLGLEVRLPSGETARFSSLAHAAPVSTADANGVP